MKKKTYTKLQKFAFGWLVRGSFYPDTMLENPIPKRTLNSLVKRKVLKKFASSSGIAYELTSFGESEAEQLGFDLSEIKIERLHLKARKLKLRQGRKMTYSERSEYKHLYKETKSAYVQAALAQEPNAAVLAVENLLIRLQYANKFVVR